MIAHLALKPRGSLGNWNPFDPELVRYSPGSGHAERHDGGRSDLARRPWDPG